MSPQTVDGMHCTMCERGKKVHIQSHSHPLPMPPETQQEVSALLVECLSLSTESCLEPQGNSAATTLFLQLRKHAKLLKEVGRLGSVPLEPISGAPTVLKGGGAVFEGGRTSRPRLFTRHCSLALSFQKQTAALTAYKLELICAQARGLIKNSSAQPE